MKSLKTSLNEKNKRIKLLEKKIESLRNSEVLRKDICNSTDIYDGALDEDIPGFKDYESVQVRI